MSDPVTTTLLVTSLVATGAQAVESRKTRKKSEAAARSAEADQARLGADREKRESQERQRARDVARRALFRPNSESTAGRRGNILTSPLGLPGDAGSERKTALGA